MSVAPQIAAPSSQSPARVTAKRTHVRPAYSVLYSFKGYPDDGADPFAGLINVGSTLYGTTSKGGSSECNNQGCGTVFAITTSGGETVLHSFIGKKGSDPWAALLDVGDTLYGTTADGGANKYYGTVFSMTTSGAETVLHSFNGTDGEQPYAGLLNVKGTLYGTTYNGGGAIAAGTVFAITTSGKETVLYSFCSIASCKDGAYPIAGLIDVKGTLYGTTNIGGANGDGTVFSITPSGKETVLYSFGAGSYDGENPEAALLDVNGTLYGTTYGGGANGCLDGCGTVFSITTAGTEKVLHSFGTRGVVDGEYPEAGLIDVKGTLYGTTVHGGARCYGRRREGCGTVFAITTSDKETVLYSFKGGKKDGEYPYAGLINVNGTLYDTTEEGGANSDGTVFSLSP
jgi:uncharacterized repeat protein (TIGR03803 family)